MPSISGLPDLIAQLELAKNKLAELHGIMGTILGTHSPPPVEPRKITETQLSSTEKKVLQLLRQNKSSQEAADILNVSRRTIEAHRYNIQRKLGLKGTQLKKWATSGPE